MGTKAQVTHRRKSAFIGIQISIPTHFHIQTTEWEWNQSLILITLFSISRPRRALFHTDLSRIPSIILSLCVS
jgi:hypothetical protein